MEGLRLPSKELLEKVGEYVKILSLNNRFKDDVSRSTWFRAFYKRHKLSIKKNLRYLELPEKSLDTFIINNYFDLLNKTLKLRLENKPDYIYDQWDKFLSFSYKLN